MAGAAGCGGGGASVGSEPYSVAVGIPLQLLAIDLPIKQGKSSTESCVAECSAGLLFEEWKQVAAMFGTEVNVSSVTE